MSSPISFDDETTPKGKLSSDQLAAIGAVTIAFNEVEAHLDIAFCASFAFGQDAV